MAGSIKKLVSAIRTSFDKTTSSSRSSSRPTSQYSSAQPTPTKLHHPALDCDAIDKAVPGLSLMPTELIIMICTMAGFTPTLTLAMTCTRMHAIVMNPAAWHDYTTYTPDVIESRIAIVTKLSTFDHLLFGEWPRPADAAGGRGMRLQSCDSAATLTDEYTSTSTSTTSTSTSTSTTCKARTTKTLFFEHRAFADHFDFLGGVELNVWDDGNVGIDFFDHVEQLPCQQLQPASPTSHSPIASSEHTCRECYPYRHRRLMRNFFVFDQQEVVDWEVTTKPAFEWVWESRNGRRRVIITVSPQRNVRGFAPVGSLPFVTTEGVVVNGVQLQGSLRIFWERFVTKRAAGGKQV
ncbi:hypothetical protein SeMB42_g07319 [Synchytrium endobioticum]|uniref:F-box domain-containing protein n=1 Tax=Synchytrium endobioticum TaxID=286115 RepID=A0A507CA64_9FUNG|nr:hypothetical protein SeMB42_g07319 [Synchytrium endobioticum]TPX39499.1 hypothetical protein SeLEV6574_g07163 [Synchytrium endobioticum]